MDDLLKQVDKEDRANVRKMDIYKEHASLLKEINMEIVEIGKANKTTVEALIQQESKLKGLTGLQANLVGLDRKRLKAQQSLGAGSQEALNNLADKNKEILALSAEDEISIGRLQAERNRLLDIVKQDASISEELTQNAKDQGEIADNTAKLSEKQQKHLTKQLEVYEGIKDTIGGILETASLLTSTVGGVLGGALIGAGAAGKALFHTMHELGGSIGATNTVATTLFSKVFPDAVGTVKELSKEFGGLSDVSLKTQFRTNVIAKNLGIGAGEAASLTGQFARLNDGSAETAQNLIMQTKNLAQQNGLVPTAVMADVANSAE